jgi:hypothetical protein
MMTLETVLERLGLPVEVAEGGAARFKVDDKVVVQLELTSDHQHLLLRSAVGHSHDTGPSELTREIAVANYAGAASGGGSLGLNPVNGEILLFA